MHYTNNQLICCTVGFTNRYWQNTDQSVDTNLVFISDPKEIQGFYYWNIHKISNTITLVRCSDAQVGFLCIYVYSQVPIAFYDICDTNPKLVYDNYLQDIQTKVKYNMFYSEYMEGVIDELISHQHQDCPTWDNPNTVVNFASSVVIPPSSVAPPPLASNLNDLVVTEPDIYNHSKKFGFLAHSEHHFTFIGPDRCPTSLDNLDSYIFAAKIIKETGLPNYRMARFPIQSGLNIEAWRRYLTDYPDKTLIEYLTYGFPLSITNCDSLCNHDISNHYSALQFPVSVDQYLQKETDLGAMLGPFDQVNTPFYHCSPLLTRPKGNNDRRVILNLSCPAGASLNDAVTKHLFDGKFFTLKKIPNCGQHCGCH